MENSSCFAMNKIGRGKTAPMMNGSALCRWLAMIRAGPLAGMLCRPCTRKPTIGPMVVRTKSRMSRKMTIFARRFGESFQRPASSLAVSFSSGMLPPRGG